MISGEKTGIIKWSEDFICEYPALDSLISNRDEKGNITFSPMDEESMTITVKDAFIFGSSDALLIQLKNNANYS